MRLDDFKTQYINNTVNYLGSKRRAVDFLGITLKTIIKYTKDYDGPVCNDFIPTKNLDNAIDDYLESLFYLYKFSTGKVADHIGMSHRFTYNKKIKIFSELPKKEKEIKLPKIESIEKIPDVYLKIFPTNEERLRYLDNPSVRY